MVEISNVFNKAVDHVVDICGKTLVGVEQSQNALMGTLEELERRLRSIAGLNERLNDSKMSDACQAIQIYKAKIERIKTRISTLRKRIANVENKINNKFPG